MVEVAEQARDAEAVAEEQGPVLVLVRVAELVLGAVPGLVDQALLEQALLVLDQLLN